MSIKFNKALMRLLLPAIIMIVATPQAVAQQYLVDYDSIANVVRTQPEVYRALTARFIEADTTLTIPEMAIVYYGRAFTPAYNPDESYEDVMKAFNSGDLNLSLSLADEALRANPVSLSMLFHLYGLCAVSEEPRIHARADNLLQRIFMECDLIFATGNGILPYSPWALISEADLDEFLVKYLPSQYPVQREIGRTDKGSEKAVRVKMDGWDDDVILYFDLLLPRNHKANH